ncbi:MAG: hypothetical protein ACP5SK_02440, partial [Thermoprotei archaeon]
MVKKAVSLLAVLLLAAAAVELASGSAPSSVVTPNAEITALHSEVTFTPFGVYVRDGIYIRAGSDGLSYLLIEVPSGT